MKQKKLAPFCQHTVGQKTCFVTKMLPVECDATFLSFTELCLNKYFQLIPSREVKVQRVYCRALSHLRHP